MNYISMLRIMKNYSLQLKFLNKSDLRIYYTEIYNGIITI